MGNQRRYTLIGYRHCTGVDLIIFTFADQLSVLKKIAAIFLLFTMLICSCGLLISYHLNLYSIHLHQREIILHSVSFDSKILTFAFPKDYHNNKDYDLEFEGEDEMMLDGKMYDIIAEHASHDSIFVKCISDENEDEVRAEAGRQIEANTGTSTHENSPGIKFNPGVYIDHLTAESTAAISTSSIVFFYFKISPELFHFSNVPSPPPWNNS